MCNKNTFLNNIGLDDSSSLVHLLDKFSEYDIDENDINIAHSKYVNETEFISTLQRLKNGLSILSLNIQSIRAKFNEFQIFIDNIHKSAEISVICLQETWLSENCNASMYRISGYTLLSRGKSCTAHGGLITYVHNSLSCKILNYEYAMTNWECLTVEIYSNTSFKSKIIVNNIYHKPYETIENLNIFVGEMADFLSGIKVSNTYLVGDFNIDLLKVSVNGKHNDFLNLMMSHSFLPSITLPTRIETSIHRNSKTLIDNIFVRRKSINDYSGILMNSFSDHKAIFICQDIKLRNNVNKYIEIEQCTDVNMANMKNELKHSNVLNALNTDPSSDPNKNYNLFNH